MHPPKTQLAAGRARGDPGEGLTRAFAVVGTPEQCAEQIQALLALGFQAVSCNLAPVRRSSNFVGLPETLAGAAEMLTLLK